MLMVYVFMYTSYILENCIHIDTEFYFFFICLENWSGLVKPVFPKIHVYVYGRGVRSANVVKSDCFMQTVSV